jgi:uncharacterized protein YfiM (DUF2279 family)
MNVIKKKKFSIGECGSFFDKGSNNSSCFLGKTTGLMVVLAATLNPAMRAQADPLFGIDVLAGGKSEIVAYDTMLQLLDSLDSSFDLATINPKYSTTAGATVTADLRGVDIQVIYPATGANVSLSIPSLGIERNFETGSTREQNNESLVEYLQSNQGNILTEVNKSLAATTATDPIAGNPTSMLSRMATSSFDAGTGVAESGGSEASASLDEEKSSKPASTSARLGRYTADGVTQTVIDLPLSYTIPLSDPRYGVVLDAPLTYVEAAGTATFALSLGAGLRVPVYDNWTITPAVRFGATGSIDLGSAATMYGGSITSSYRWSSQDLNWELGNMFGYNQTGGALSAGDLEIDYDLQNNVIRNGLSVSKPTSGSLFGEQATWNVSVVNTQISGDDVFIDNYSDVAVSYGTKASENGLTWDSVRLGLTYTFANEDYSGFRLNFGYQF